VSGGACESEGHPGVTFNPWLGRTWCNCGAVVKDGNTVVLPKWWDREGKP